MYLVWKNGKKTKHDTSVIYKKCPQKVSFSPSVPALSSGMLYSVWDKEPFC